MHDEYKAITDAGLLLQIDDPRLVTQYVMDASMSIADCRKWAELRVEALNHALRDMPEEQIRYHTCYSIDMGPRTNDMEAKDIVDIILKIKAGAYSFEGANPRHEHEWKVWNAAKLPAHKVLIPGVITHSTVLVEHPELVCDRILRYAQRARPRARHRRRRLRLRHLRRDADDPSDRRLGEARSTGQGARMASQQLWGRAAA